MIRSPLPVLALVVTGLVCGAVLGPVGVALVTLNGGIYVLVLAMFAAVLGAFLGLLGTLVAIVIVELVRLATSSPVVEATVLVASSALVFTLGAAWTGHGLVGLVTGVVAGIANVLVTLWRRSRAEPQDGLVEP